MRLWAGGCPDHLDQILHGFAVRLYMEIKKYFSRSQKGKACICWSAGPASSNSRIVPSVLSGRVPTGPVFTGAEWFRDWGPVSPRQGCGEGEVGLRQGCGGGQVVPRPGAGESAAGRRWRGGGSAAGRPVSPRQGYGGGEVVPQDGSGCVAALGRLRCGCVAVALRSLDGRVAALWQLRCRSLAVALPLPGSCVAVTWRL